MAKKDLPAAQIRLKPACALRLDVLCGELVAQQRQRRFCIKSQSRCDRAIESFLAGHLGYRADLDPDEGKALFKRARRIRTAVEKRGEAEDPAIQPYVEMIKNSAESRKIWDVHRLHVEAEMRRIAQQLPAFGWVEGVRGFSALGLAVIIGESGNLDRYSTVAKVWKRFGLAVIEGKRQQKCLDKELAKKHGYNPQRRAEMWAFFSDAMIRAVWRGARGDLPAYSIGPHGAEYARKKEEYLSRGWTKAHSDAAARHYMTKCVLHDLWSAWRAEARSAETLEEAA